MICFLVSFVYAGLGLLLYFTWKAKTYLINGSFDFKEWRKRNLHRFIYSCLLLLILLSIFKIAPELLEVLKTMIGLSFDVDGDMPEDASPIILGLSIGSFVYGVQKTYSETKTNEQEASS